jgi:hypothetical protein
MTDNTEQSSPRGRPTSNDEQITVTSIESTTNETITALVNGNPLFDSNTINNSRDDNPERLRRRSSVSIIQALVNTSHILTTNDARKR